MVAGSGAEALNRTIGCLRDQSLAHKIELLIVARVAARIDPAQLGAASFAALRMVRIGEITARGQAAATGLGAASAPVVALVEDHSYPEPGWAAALLAAHRGSWAAAGPRVRNANPRSAVSRANFWLSYAAFAGPQPPGPRPLLPWHNTAYKRDVLIPYGERLGELLDWEGDLQADLRASGHELYLEPAACTAHENASALASVLDIFYQRGRILGGRRADRARWSRTRRLLYAIAAPAFPLMHIARLAPDLRRMRVGMRELLGTAPALVILVAALSVGEAAGHLRGPGDAMERLQQYELRRGEHLR